MESNEVVLEKKGPIAEVVLNRAQKRNAITNQMGAELVSVLEACAEDQEVKVILLRGEGKAFCAGRDLGELSGGEETPLDLYVEESILDRIYLTMQSIRKPIVAAAHGFTMGGGIGLLTMSHFVVAAEDARFSLPEINIGLFPLGVAAVLWQAVGAKKAIQLGLLGEPISAAEARSLGLVDYTVPAEALRDKAWELAEKLSQKKSAGLMAGIDAYHVLSREEFLNKLKTFQLMLIPFLTEMNRDKAKA